MLTISTPSELSPFDRPAEFVITSTTPATDAGTIIDAVLTDADSGTVLATRRIHLDNNGSARFDAAPVLRRSFVLRPAAGASGLAVAEDCRFRVVLSVGAVRSKAVTLLSTEPDINALTLISGMSAKRTIRYGESDRLIFYSQSDFTVSIEVQTPSGTKHYSYNWKGDAGLVALRLRTTDFDPAAQRITVMANRTTAAEYTVEPSTADSVRLAWRSTAGVVEHYTFPIVVRRTLVSGRRTVRLADGTCTVAGSEHVEAVLRSAYENAATVATIAEAAISPQVWVVDGDTGEYISVDVLTQQVATHSFGEPSNVELTVRPSQNGVRI